MVRAIYVGQKGSFSRSIVRLGDCDPSGPTGDACKACFDDMTSNFEELDLWHSERHLDGKTGADIERTIREIQWTLAKENIVARVWTQEDDESHTWPSWVWDKGANAPL